MNIHDPHVLLYIKTIGYPTMFFLMVVEGPIATILSAFAASLGFFNIFIVLFLSITGDMAGDIILYAIGYFGGTRILEKAGRLLKTQPAFIQKMEKRFRTHGRKIIIAVKSTTGLCWITFIAAGSFRMDFKKFLSGSFWGGIIWSSFLVAAGYFFGYAFEEISSSIRSAGIIIFVSFAIFYILITLYKKYQAKKILQSNNGNGG